MIAAVWQVATVLTTIGGTPAKAVIGWARGKLGAGVAHVCCGERFWELGIAIS